MKTILFFIIMVCGMHVVLAGRHIPIESFKDSGYYEHQFNNGILKIQRIRQDDGLSAPYTYHVRLYPQSLSVRMVYTDGSESPDRIYKIHNEKTNNEVEKLTAEDFTLALLKGEQTSAKAISESYELENVLLPWKLKKIETYENIARWSLPEYVKVTEIKKTTNIEPTSNFLLFFLSFLTILFFSRAIYLSLKTKEAEFLGFTILALVSAVLFNANGIPSIKAIILLTAYNAALGLPIGLIYHRYQKNKAAKKAIA